MEDFFEWLIPILNQNSIDYEMEDELTIQAGGISFQYCFLGTSPHDNAILIWEDWWTYKREIVKSKILGKLKLLKKIPARLCVIKRIEKSVSENFLKRNHLQGNTTSKIKYGIFLPEKYYRVLDFKPFDKDEILLGVTTFSGGRKFRDDSVSYELFRYCILNGYTIQGGFSKVLKHFKEEKQPDSIMTYVDLDWYTSGIYEQFGFKESGFYEPMFFSLDKNGNRIEDSKYEVFNKGSLKLIWTK